MITCSHIIYCNFLEIGFYLHTFTFALYHKDFLR